MEQFKGTENPWYAIDFSGYWRLCDEPFYEGLDIMDAGNVGEECAKKQVTKLSFKN